MKLKIKIHNKNWMKNNADITLVISLKDYITVKIMVIWVHEYVNVIHRDIKPENLLVNTND